MQWPVIFGTLGGKKVKVTKKSEKRAWDLFVCVCATSIKNTCCSVVGLLFAHVHFVVSTTPAA